MKLQYPAQGITQTESSKEQEDEGNKASGTGRDDVTRQQKKLYKELNNMISPNNIINKITLTKIGWARYVVCAGI